MSASDGYSIRIMVIVATSVFAAVALIYASIRHRDVWAEHMKVAVLSLTAAGFGTLSYTWVEATASTPKQAQLLPYLQLFKDMPGLVIVGYIAVMTPYKVPSIYVQRRTYLSSFLTSAKVVLPAAAVLMVAITTANPDKSGNLDTMLTPWAFGYRTVFCLPLVIYALVSATVALQSYLSRDVSLVRARTGFAAGGSWFLSLMALSYITWPVVHYLTALDPKQTILYVAVEGTLWSAMALCWVGALKAGSHRSSVGAAMKDFEAWDYHTDQLLGYTSAAGEDNRAADENYATLRQASREPDNGSFSLREAEYIQAKTFDIANNQLQHKIPASELCSAQLSLYIISIATAQTAHLGTVSWLLRSTLEHHGGISQHEATCLGSWLYEVKLDDTVGEDSAVVDDRIPEAIQSILIALSAAPYPEVRCLPLPPMRTQLTCIAIAHAGLLTSDQNDAILTASSPYANDNILWAYDFAKLSRYEPLS